jgi:pimeloyl-ACP methyl ester carboxylesterase
MHVILIPGLWLDGATWDKVMPTIVGAGHVPHPLTLPGMESADADRSEITLSDHVDAVVAEIDSIDPADGPVVLVGHSAGAGIASIAVDARPDRVGRAVYVGGFPAADGDPLVDGFTAVNGEVPLPDWSDFDEADLTDLDEAARADFRRRAIPSPEQVIVGPVRLNDERRFDVPVTVVCPEFTSEMLRGWIERELPPVREFTKIRQLEYVDLPTGHWPQVTRPDALAQIIIASAAALAGDRA